MDRCLDHNPCKFRENIYSNEKVFHASDWFRLFCWYGEKRKCAKFQIDISETELLVRIYTDWRTDKLTARQAQHTFNIYFTGFPTFPSGCYDVLWTSYPAQGINTYIHIFSGFVLFHYLKIVFQKILNISNVILKCANINL